MLLLRVVYLVLWSVAPLGCFRFTSNRQVFVRFCGERLRRRGVRDGEIDFRRIVGLLWFVLCRWLFFLVFLCFCVVVSQRANSCFRCSMWNMALFLRWILSESRSSSMISYCVIVSSVIVSSASGVTEVLLPSGDEYSSSSCLPIREADRHNIGGLLAVLQYWVCIGLSRSSRKVSRPSQIVIGLSQVADNKQSTYYETHSVSNIAGIVNERRYL